MKMYAFFLCFLIFGCASTLDKAKELEEQNAFADAIVMYEKALEEDASDSEAASGLRRTRGKWMSKRLIEVRMSRLGGNWAASLDMLRGLVEKQNAWKQFPAGNILITQRQETDKAFSTFTSKVSMNIQTGKALKADHIMATYKALFTQNEMLRKISSLKSKSREVGKKRCHDWVQSKDHEQPYFAEFLASYCRYFGVVENKLFTIAKKQNLDGYKLKDLKMEATFNSKPMNVNLKEKMKGVFERSVWAHPQGVHEIELKLQGAVQFHHQRMSQRRSHDYVEKQPFTAFKNVKQGRRKDGSLCEDDYDCENRVSRSILVTEYKNVNKQHTYYGTYHNIDLKSDLQVIGAKDTLQVHLNHSDEKHYQGFEHDNSVPQIGLYPQAFNAPTRTALIESEWSEMERKFSSELEDLWVQKNCHSVVSNPSNSVFKCLKVNMEKKPDFVVNYFQSTFGLEHDQVAQLL